MATDVSKEPTIITIKGPMITFSLELDSTIWSKLGASINKILDLLGLSDRSKGSSPQSSGSEKQ